MAVDITKYFVLLKALSRRLWQRQRQKDLKKEKHYLFFFSLAKCEILRMTKINFKERNFCGLPQSPQRNGGNYNKIKSRSLAAEIFKLLVFITAFLAYLNAAAVTVDANINSIDAGRFGKSISPGPSYQQKVSPKLKVLPPPTQGIEGKQAEEIKFKLTEVIIEGNTIYPSHELIAIFKPYYNKEISLAVLQKLVNAITTKYRNAGYILSTAILPPQHIKNGVVRVQIVEGFIDKVTISGHPGRARKLLEAYGKRITQSKPLKMQVLERYMLLANDIPGEEARAILTPSAQTPGATDLNIVAQHRYVEGSLSYDNYGTPYIGPEEYTATMSANSIFRSGDSTTIRSLVSQNTRQARFIGGVYNTPLGASGTQLSLGGSYTRTQPGSILSPLEILGTSENLFADVKYPIIRSRAKNLFIHAGFNYLNSTSIILEVPFYEDRIRSLQAGGFYNFADSWLGSNTISLDVEHGLDILNASGDQDISRPDGRADFTKLSAQLSRLQLISQRLSLLIASQGQYAFNPLLISEQFGFGGSDFGRGYDPSEILGDQGIAGKAELRIDTAPDFAVLKKVQYYTFYDAGVIWNRDTQTQPARASATSVGAGARIDFTRYFSGNVYIAQPLTLPVASAVATGGNGYASSVFFQALLKFN